MTAVGRRRKSAHGQVRTSSSGGPELQPSAAEAGRKPSASARSESASTRGMRQWSTDDRPGSDSVRR